MSSRTREKNFWRKNGVSNLKNVPEAWDTFGGRLADITDEDLDFFTLKVKTVDTVTLGENEVTNEGISYLPRLEYLRELDLKNLDIDDRCIPDLLKLQGLEWLHIKSTGISSAGVEKLLTGLKNLKTLIFTLYRKEEAMGKDLRLKYPDRDLAISYK